MPKIIERARWRYFARQRDTWLLRYVSPHTKHPLGTVVIVARTPHSLRVQAATWGNYHDVQPGDRIECYQPGDNFGQPSVVLGCEYTTRWTTHDPIQADPAGA